MGVNSITIEHPMFNELISCLKKSKKDIEAITVCSKGV